MARGDDVTPHYVGIPGHPPQQHPEQPVAVVGAEDGVRRDAGRVVVGEPREEPLTPHLPRLGFRVLQVGATANLEAD